MSECEHKDLLSYINMDEPCYQCGSCKKWLTSGDVIKQLQSELKKAREANEKMEDCLSDVLRYINNPSLEDRIEHLLGIQ